MYSDICSLVQTKRRIRGWGCLYIYEIIDLHTEEFVSGRSQIQPLLNAKLLFREGENKAVFITHTAGVSLACEWEILFIK
jgi:hypothetical protein